MRIACYPGSFDPITNGHVEIALRALKMFDKLIIIVADNYSKKYYFSTEERVRIVRDTFKGYDNIEVVVGEGLSAVQAQKLGACAIIRGLRAVSDYEYECQFAAANEYLAPDIDMIFLMARKEYAFISSTHIREIYSLDGDITPLVPEACLEGFRRKNNQK